MSDDWENDNFEIKKADDAEFANEDLKVPNPQPQTSTPKPVEPKLPKAPKSEPKVVQKTQPIIEDPNEVKARIAL